MKLSLFNLHEVVLLITIAEALFLALGILMIPRKRPRSHWLLAGLLIMIGVILATTLAVWNPHLQTTVVRDSSLLVGILTFALLSHGPLLYLYMGSLTAHRAHSRWHAGAHLAPAALATGAVLAGGVTVHDWLPWHWGELNDTKQQLVRAIWALFKCQPVVYAALCWWAEIRLRRQLKDRYAALPFWEMRWAELILGGFTLHWLWAFAAYWLSGSLSGAVNDWMGIVSNYVTVALVNSLFVFAMYSGRRALILPDIPAPAKDSEDVEALAEKLAAIKRAIDDEHLYRDPHINLERFAEHCEIKPRELSTLINSHYHRNFFEFINYYRVQAVKQALLKEPEQPILDIALAAGFNSQSAFQRFFKRIEGMTPSQYRRQGQPQKTSPTTPGA